MTKTWFYHYTGGYCGTDEYGLIKAETEQEACELMEGEAMEHAIQWAEDPRGGNILEDENGDAIDPDEGLYMEIESDLYVQPYDPAEHNGHLNGNEEGYIPDEE